MNTADYCVTLDALKELAAPFEPTITRQWVSKYVRLGLLPPQHAPGLGRGRGRQNLYSKPLVQQFVPLLSALKQHGKNLPVVGWDLWWHGYYAHSIYWRDRLIEKAIIWSQIKARFPDSEAEDGAKEKLIQEIGANLSERNNAGPLIGSVKRHAPDQLQDFLEIMLSIINGSYAPLNSNSQDEYERERLSGLFSRSLSIPVTASEIPDDKKHFPTNVDDMDGMFQSIAGFSQVDVASFADALTNSEIQDARTELAIFMAAVGAIEQASLDQSGRSAGAKPVLWSNKDADGQASILLGWLLLRRDTVMREKLEGLNKIIREQIKLGQAGDNAA